VARKRKCPKFEQYAAITPKQYEIGCQLLLITNRKSHTGFPSAQTSMTSNDLERRNSPYFGFFYRILQIFSPIISQWLKIDQYNVRKILSPSSSLLLLAKTITHPAARSLCDSWASWWVKIDARCTAV